MTNEKKKSEKILRMFDFSEKASKIEKHFALQINRLSKSTAIQLKTLQINVLEVSNSVSELDAIMWRFTCLINVCDPNNNAN